MEECYKPSNEDILKIIKKISSWNIPKPYKKLAEVYGYIYGDDKKKGCKKNVYGAPKKEEYLMVQIEETENSSYNISITQGRARLDTEIRKETPEFSQIENILVNARENVLAQTKEDYKNMTRFLAKILGKS